MNYINYFKAHCEEYANNILIVEASSSNEYTYKEFYDECIARCSNFNRMGLKKGSRLIVVANNSIDLAKIYFSCLFYGICVVPVNPLISVFNFKFIMNDSSPDACLIEDNLIDTLGQNESISNVYSISKFFENNNINHNDRSFLNEIFENDDLILIYTSGTTGKPKGVLHTYYDLFENGKRFCEVMGINSDAIFYNLLSMTYLGGYYNLLLIPFISGGSVVITETFNPTMMINFWKDIIKYQVNTLWLVPTIIAMILKMDRSDEGINYIRKNKLPYIICGTAPLSKIHKSSFQEKYNIPIYENYGLTESLFISTNNQISHSHGVGEILEELSIRIINNKGEDVTYKGEEGEVEILSPYLMKQCLDNGKINNIDQTDWFKTGDIAIIEVIDSKKYLNITGRKKDIIIRGGINISPISIEEEILKHKSVLEVAVVGVPHDIMGEEIIAVIRINNDSLADEIINEINKICKKSLPAVKQPSKIFILTDFPHTYSGKIQKGKIKNWITQRLNSSNNKTNKTISKDVSLLYFKASQVVSKSIEAISIRYNNIVYDLKRNGIKPIVLSLGEAFFDIPLESFDDLPYPDGFHYSHSRGIIDLRKKLAQYFLTEYDAKFDPDKEIIITSGSKIAIHMSILSTIDPGDEVIIYEPAWVSYFEQVKLCYGIPVRIPYYEKIYNFEKYISNKTKMIIINNPNNPTGRVYDIEELSYLYELTKKYNLFILSDEAYSDFVEPQDKFISMLNLDAEKKYTIICNSISKNFGISGWRIGYVISNEYLINELLKVNQHLITCPATILEYYVSKHFFDIISLTKPQIKKLLIKRKEIKHYMDKIGLEYLEGDSTFYFFVSIEPSKFDSDTFCEKLLQEHYISTVPGIGYGKSCDKFIRMSIGTETIKDIEKALDIIKILINNTRF